MKDHIAAQDLSSDAGVKLEELANAALSISSYAEHDIDCSNHKDGSCSCGYTAASQRVIELADQVAASCATDAGPTPGLTPVPAVEDEALAKEYRPSMDREIVHAWAVDAVARIRSLSARVVVLEADARRWQALMRCGRISMQGSSGVEPETGARSGSNVHFGAEFWPEPASTPEMVERYRKSTAWGVACLTALADAILEREALPKEARP